MYQSSQPRSFTNQLNEWVQQPIFFAAIASLGLHGVLFAALPSFSPTPISDDSQRTVPVVELGTEDINRLPSFVDLDTPNVPQAVVPYDPYEFASPLASSDGLDSLEQLLNDLDTNPSSSPSSDDFLIPQPTPLPAPISPPSPLSSSWPFGLPRPNPRPTPIPTPTPAQPTPVPNSSESNSSELDNNELDNNESDNNESDRTTSQDGSNAEDSGTTSTEAEAGSNQVAATPTATESAPSASLEETQASLTELFQYTGPTDTEALEKAFNTARENWNKLIVERPDITATDETYDIFITAEYPKFACLLQTDDIDVMIAVFVDATNQILEMPEPIYLLRSWRPWFDDEALKLIKAHEFDNQTGMTTSYAVTVTFDYEPEKCPLAPAVPSSTTGTEVPSQPDAIPNPVSPSPNSAATDSAETSGAAEIPDSSEPSDAPSTNDSAVPTDPAGTADPSTTIDQDLSAPNVPDSADSEMSTPEPAADTAMEDEDATAPASEPQLDQ
ncbi:MAG: hypothetical protein F6K30_09245 [Cyanothece sp. SIO2G6]|nr:hypothetical protein [Cyanothece sp. SIO2G6]